MPPSHMHTQPDPDYVSVFRFSHCAKRAVKIRVLGQACVLVNTQVKEGATVS